MDALRYILPITFGTLGVLSLVFIFQASAKNLSAMSQLVGGRTRRFLGFIPYLELHIRSLVFKVSSFSFGGRSIYHVVSKVKFDKSLVISCNSFENLKKQRKKNIHFGKIHEVPDLLEPFSSAYESKASDLSIAKTIFSEDLQRQIMDFAEHEGKFMSFAIHQSYLNVFAPIANNQVSYTRLRQLLEEMAKNIEEAVSLR